MREKERHQGRPQLLLIQKGLVSEDSVVEILTTEVLSLSYWEILEGLGFEVRPEEIEIALMEEIRREWAIGQKVTFDESTSVRLQLVDLIIDMYEKGVISKDNRTGKGRDSVRYYLASQREMLLSRGLISLTPEEPKKDTYAESHADFYSRPLKPRGLSSKISL